MALTDENGGMSTTMLVSPTGNVGGTSYPYPVYQSNGGNAGFGQDGWWIVLLIILLAAGGWNGNNNGGSNGGFFGGVPYVVNNDGNYVQRGFDQAAIMGGINGIQSTLSNGFSNVQQSLCNGFAGVNATVSNGFAQAEIAENARQMANMQQMFNLSTQFADCCCENRLGIANLGSDIAREACATRTNDTQNTQSILNVINGGIQSIKDQLCSDKIDAKNEKIADLERQLTMANIAASQTAQTASIRAGQVAEIDAMYQRLRDCPVPTMPVYGMTPIFTCPNNNNTGCGCGCNSGF